MAREFPFTRNPLLNDEQMAELLERVALWDSPSRTQLTIYMSPSKQTAERNAFQALVPMTSLPGVSMAFNDTASQAGAEVLYPTGRRISLGDGDAIQQFAAANKLTLEEVGTLLKFDARAERHRTPAQGTDRFQSNEGKHRSLIDDLESVIGRRDGVASATWRDLQRSREVSRYIHANEFRESAIAAFGFALPDDWSGEIQVQASVAGPTGTHRAELASGEAPHFYGVYAHRKEGTYVHLQDLPTVESAERLVERLLLVDAHAEFKRVEREAKLARLREAALRRVPNQNDHGAKRGRIGIDASPALMALLGTRAIYSVGEGQKASDHYYLEVVCRNDGVHDLYLKYQVILGQRLLGGLSQDQVDVLRARCERRLPLPTIGAPAPAGDADRSLSTRIDQRNVQIGNLLGDIQHALAPRSAVADVSPSRPTPATPARRGRSAPKSAPAKAPVLQTEEPSRPREAHETALPANAASKARAIDPEVLRVLRNGRTEDNKFFLGPERLDPKLYKKVNEVLKDLGGAWKGGKTQAHLFEGQADEAVAAVIASGEYLTAKDFGFFFTSAPQADSAVARARLAPGMLVLEPSAGSGSLALRAAEIVGLDNVFTCEYLDRNVAKLRAAGLSNVVHGDFLAMEPRPIYDAVIMNPPFGNLQDVRHVEHAAKFLKPDGVLVAIMSRSFQYRSTSAAAKFRNFAEQSLAEVEEIPAGAFREAGTEVATVMVRMDASNFPWNQVQTLDEDEDEVALEAPRA